MGEENWSLVGRWLEVLIRYRDFIEQRRQAAWNLTPPTGKLRFSRSNTIKIYDGRRSWYKKVTRTEAVIIFINFDNVLNFFYKRCFLYLIFPSFTIVMFHRRNVQIINIFFVRKISKNRRNQWMGCCYLTSKTNLPGRVAILRTPSVKKDWHKRRKEKKFARAMRGNALAAVFISEQVLRLRTDVLKVFH